MNICRLSEVSPDRISVNCLSFIRYIHHLKVLTVRGRKRSAFMCVTDGSFFYQFDGGELTLATGDILYLPEGAHYRYTLNEGLTECLQIEVEISVDGQRTAFSDHPVKLSKNISQMREMLETLENGAGELEKNAAVFALLGCLLRNEDSSSSVSSRILPAVRHIDIHYKEPLRMADMAALCHLSQSQMRRLFRSELGMSPIEYKNHRRMDAACNMLRYTYNRISEIADTLGFDNVYIFSRVFRKYMGVSPTQYRNFGESGGSYDKML